MEKYSSFRTRGLILSGPGAFRESSLHKSLLIPAVVIVMQSIGLYGGGSRRDAVSLSVVGVTLSPHFCLRVICNNMCPRMYV